MAFVAPALTDSDPGVEYLRVSLTRAGRLRRAHVSRGTGQERGGEPLSYVLPDTPLIFVM